MGGLSMACSLMKGTFEMTNNNLDVCSILT